MKKKHKYKYVPYVGVDKYDYAEFISYKKCLEEVHEGKIKNVEVVRNIFGDIKYFAFDVEVEND